MGTSFCIKYYRESFGQHPDLSWAIVNFLIATGVRASTAVNIKICDIDFEHNIIRLRKLKNRKQQIIPLSTSLKAVLELYLQLWDWESEYNLFPTSSNSQMTVHALETAVRHFNIGRGVTKTSLHLFRHTFAKNYMPNALLHGARSHPLLPLEPDEADRYDDDGDGNDYGIAVSPFQLRHVAKVHAVPARDER